MEDGRAGVIYQEFDVGRSLAHSIAAASSSAARSLSRHSRSGATAPFHCRNNRGRYASSRDEEEARRRDASSEGRKGGRSDPEIKNMMKRRRRAAEAAAARSEKGKVGGEKSITRKDNRGSHFERPCCLHCCFRAPGMGGRGVAHKYTLTCITA